MRSPPLRQYVRHVWSCRTRGWRNVYGASINLRIGAKACDTDWLLETMAKCRATTVIPPRPPTGKLTATVTATQTGNATGSRVLLLKSRSALRSRRDPTRPLRTMRQESGGGHGHSTMNVDGIESSEGHLDVSIVTSYCQSPQGSY